MGKKVLKLPWMEKDIREEISNAAVTINSLRDFLHGEEKAFRGGYGLIVRLNYSKKSIKYVYNFRQFYLKKPTNYKGEVVGREQVCEDLFKQVKYTNICSLLKDLKEYIKRLNYLYSTLVNIYTVYEE